MKFICDGCGNEFDWADRFPQKQEGYCRMCNKKFPDWDKWKRGMYEAFDREKANLFAEKKIEFFGRKENILMQTEQYMTQPQGRISEKQRENLDHSKVAEGQMAVDPLESFDPSLQPLVKKIKKEIGVPVQPQMREPTQQQV